MSVNRNTRLALVALMALAAVLSFDVIAYHQVERTDRNAMLQATELARDWFELVCEEKQQRGIVAEIRTGIEFQELLGAEFTPVTTTLGSLEAKELSTNPAFAALVLRLIHEAGLDSTARIGVTLSGSFPALGIATLAALDVLGTEVILTSSLGASSYGANQPGALWIDYEQWLVTAGELSIESRLLTRGGEADNGKSIYTEGIEIIDSTLVEYGIDSYLPANLQESIDYKYRFFTSNEIDLLINIGGNQASLGSCNHSLVIPPGLIRELPDCEHVSQGLIYRLVNADIPVIQLLNIRDLALNYRITHPNNGVMNKSGVLFSNQQLRPLVAFGLLIFLLGSVWWVKTNT